MPKTRVRLSLRSLIRLQPTVFFSTGLVIFFTPVGHAQTCGGCPASFSLAAQVCAEPGTTETGTTACHPTDPAFRNCQLHTVSSLGVSVVPQGGGLFEARLSVRIETPYNSNIETPGNGKLDLFWKSGAPANSTIYLCENNTTDVTRTYIPKSNLSCAGAPYDFGAFSLRAIGCSGAGMSCEEISDLANLPFKVTKRHLFCTEPPLFACNNDAACTTC